MPTDVRCSLADIFGKMLCVVQEREVWHGKVPALSL